MKAILPWLTSFATALLSLWFVGFFEPERENFHYYMPYVVRKGMPLFLSCVIGALAGSCVERLLDRKPRP